VDAQLIIDRQPQLLGQALRRLRSAPAERSQLYFVGFAGFAGQAVFKREVLAVRQLFDQRFGTRGRSITLINHRDTADDLPLATSDNLEQVQQHLGTLVDAQRDTLFLFLSSHGNMGTLTIELPGSGIGQLTPEQLSTMLDGSGIRNRVVIISACHSGSFIPVLASPTTLVITAARADRTSFGCSDKRWWTYFGDAYFNHALRRDTSFTRAFARAKLLIRLWEAREKLMPSLPQMAGGEALGPILAAMTANDQRWRRGKHGGRLNAGCVRRANGGGE
jgi:hypothetical protein